MHFKRTVFRNLRKTFRKTVLLVLGKRHGGNHVAYADAAVFAHLVTEFRKGGRDFVLAAVLHHDAKKACHLVTDSSAKTHLGHSGLLLDIHTRMREKLRKIRIGLE